jgi:uncharacterized delta-60 repeat protein
MMHFRIDSQFGSEWDWQGLQHFGGLTSHTSGAWLASRARIPIGAEDGSAGSGFTTPQPSAAITAFVPVNAAPTFHVGDGIVDVEGEPYYEHSVALTPDGKVVVATVGDGFDVVRYNADGSVDGSFDAGDASAVAIRTINDRSTSIAVQPDGKVLVAGTTAGLTAEADFALARFNADGSLDATFGLDGQVITAVSADYDVVRGMTLQSDGKFLVVGQSSPGSFEEDDQQVLVRYNSDGSLDTTFGGDGIVNTDIAPGDDRGWAVAVQADGKIVTAGSNGSSAFTVARYNADGSLDAGFGTGGTVTTAGALAGNYAVNLALQSDGKIVVGGSRVVRYNADGSLDTTFSGDGIASINLQNFEGHGLAVQLDGGILVSGTTSGPLTGVDFALLRFLADGSLDPSFGAGGTVIEQTSTLFEGRNIVLQPDGKIVIAAARPVGSYGAPAIARFNADGSLDPTFDPVDTLGHTVSFTEDGSPVVLAPDASVFDAELSPADSFDGASLRLQRAGGADADDRFQGSSSLGPLTEGADLTVGGVVIGTVTQNSGGTLLLTFNADATQERVDEAMRAIRYENASDAPPASVEIGWSFDDGNEGAQGTGGALVGEGSVTVAITGVNDAPVVTEPPAIDPEPGGEIVVTGFSVDDADSAALSVTLTASSTLTLSQSTGLAFTEGDGTGDETMTFSGALADINAAMDGMTLSPGGEDGFSYTFDDGADQTAGAWSSEVATNEAPSLLFDYGAATFDFGADDRAFGVAVQSDGKVLVAGYTHDGPDYDVALVRYNADGSLDTTFNGDGALTTGIGASDDRAYSVTVQPDGKVLVAGISHDGTDYDFALARYNTNGSLDTSFAGDGTLTTAITPMDDSARSVLVQADGKIVVAGYAYTEWSHTDLALARYNADGTPDAGFGSGGIVTTGLVGSSDDAWSAALQSDGKILAAGSINGELAVARYNVDGSLDTSFDGDGTATTSLAETARGIDVLADGKIVVAGYTGGQQGVAVLRFNPDGGVDTSFGSGGGAGTDYVELGWNVLTLQPDGKVLLAGTSSGGSSDIVLTRFNADGSLDLGFGDGGSIFTDTHLSPGSDTSDYGLTVEVQPDGKILVGGRAYDGSDSDFALVRYNSDGSLDATFDPAPAPAGATSFIEDGGPVVLRDVAVFDPELSAADSFAGASYTLQRSGGGNADDQFGASGNLGALSEGGNLVLSGTVIGTVTQNSGGTLVLTFAADATQDRVNEALRSITYENANGAPPASVDIEATFDDGNTGDQGPGGLLADTATIGVAITPVNDAPLARDDSFVLQEDDVAVGNVFDDNQHGPDVDPEDPFSVIQVNGSYSDVGSQITLPSGALVTLNADGSLTYDPNGVWNSLPTAASGASNSTSAEDTFTYTITKGSTATVHLVIEGIDSDDLVNGSGLADNLDGGIGNDDVRGLAGDDVLEGGEGNDKLDGSNGLDTLHGGGGNDTLTGGAEADVLDGGTGFDTVRYTTSVTVNLLYPNQSTGDALGDTYESIEAIEAPGNLIGDNGDNIFVGTDFTRTVFIGRGGADSFEGRGHLDRASYTTSSSGLIVNLLAPGASTGDAAGDTFISIEEIFGSRHDDVLIGDHSANRLYGYDGNDTLIGNGGADAFNGGIGTDTVSYAMATARVKVDLIVADKNTGDALGDTFVLVENVTGSVHGDVLAGSSGDNVIHGLDGNDTLRGRAGADSLFGESGSDTFLIQPGTGSDRVEDHATGVDTIRLLSFAGIDDLADLQARGTDIGISSSAYDLGGGDVLYIIGHKVADLQGGDFLFS